MAPILIFTHRKPAASFAFIRSSISSAFPIQTRPLIGIPSLPRAKGVDDRRNGFPVSAHLYRESCAVSNPIKIEG